MAFDANYLHSYTGRYFCEYLVNLIGYAACLHDKSPAQHPLDSIAGGLRAAVPVALAYLEIGFVAGALCTQAGMSPAEVGVLSLLVFAGSAQFIIAELITVSPVTLVITIFMVNLRHFLYASSFALKTCDLSLAKRMFIGAQLTDETFSVASSLIYRP